MFVITKLDVLTLKCDVLNTHQKKIDAVNDLYELLKEEENNQIVLVKNKEENIIKVYHRNIGYVYSNKTHIATYQIIQFEKESNLTVAIKKTK